MSRELMFGPSHTTISDDIAERGIVAYATKSLEEARAALDLDDREEARQALNRAKYAISKDEARMMPTPESLIQVGMIQMPKLSDAQELIAAGIDESARDYIDEVSTEIKNWN